MNRNLSRQFDWQALPEGVHHVPRNALDDLHTVDYDASHPSVRLPRRMRDVPRKYRAEVGREALARQLDPLVEDVRRRGVVEPIEVRRSPEALEVLDGNHRYVAARRARARTVPVRIEDAPWARGGTREPRHRTAVSADSGNPRLAEVRCQSMGLVVGAVGLHRVGLGEGLVGWHHPPYSR